MICRSSRKGVAGRGPANSEVKEGNHNGACGAPIALPCPSSRFCPGACRRAIGMKRLKIINAEQLFHFVGWRQAGVCRDPCVCARETDQIFERHARRCSRDGVYPGSVPL
ncbi:hypothetical protein SJ05684_c24990 [Sinorhizobium sojae CCBAU 05684]|uniref:Uncharacterized protein n=1 Tax=Sinorhizobium sojae CCBAU 05684 TaxID=716928 RepID=A0A249PFB1_9HYPH|nr:hypothetical protein SJ05684_c24990 [Sinorhizobium sojae CCBAU 05684]